MSSLHPVTFLYVFIFTISQYFPISLVILFEPSLLRVDSYEHICKFLKFPCYLSFTFHYHQKAYFVLSTYLNLLRCKLNIWSIFKNISWVLKKNKASLLAQLVKNPPANAGDARDLGSVPGPSLGRSPGEGNGSHSRILAWGISWTEESGGLQSMGSI